MQRETQCNLRLYLGKFPVTYLRGNNPCQHYQGSSVYVMQRRRLLSDEQLAESLKQASSLSLAILFDRYHRMVFNIANKILQDATQAEDVMQDVFIAVYRDADRYDPAQGTFKGWLLRYVYHQSLNRRRVWSDLPLEGEEVKNPVSARVE